MKNLVRFMVLASTLIAGLTVSSADVVTEEDRHAVEVSIGNIQTGADRETYRKLRRLIGNAVENNVIDKFVIYGYGSEGGFSACVEDKPALEPQPPSQAFENTVKKLLAIQPQPGVIYSVNRIKTCLALPDSANKPLTVEVAKPNNGISCEVSSAIPLTEMRKELSDITVYSARKELPGNLPTGCGFPTGESNLYEIAQADAVQAIELGFTLIGPISRSSCTTTCTNHLRKITIAPGRYACVAC